MTTLYSLKLEKCSLTQSGNFKIMKDTTTEKKAAVQHQEDKQLKQGSKTLAKTCK
jgi:hypothetical protein